MFTEPRVKVFALGFSGEKLELAVNFTSIMIIGIVAIGIRNVIMAFLELKNNFVIPDTSTIPQNIIIIFSILLSMRYGVGFMAWGALMGMFSIEIFRIPFAYKEGFTFLHWINGY